MSEAPIPVIDIRPFRRDAEGRARVAGQVDAACRELGFLIIEHHGLDPAMVEACWRQAGRFFDTPLENRMSAAAPGGGHPYGYHPLASEGLAYSLDAETPPDLKETFNVGPLQRPAAPPDAEAAAFAFARNLWPERPRGFREALEAYWLELRRLSDHVLEIFATALDLPAGYFGPYFRQPISALRVVNYPQPAAAPAPGQLRAGAHTDYGTLTLLLQQADRTGLQVFSRGRWHDVPAIPGTLVVNIGDLMARWTNDRWVSTLHRVVIPSAGEPGAGRRQSLVYFHTPDWDAEIACLPGCLEEGEAPRHAPVRAGPHLAGKFRKTVQA